MGRWPSESCTARTNTTAAKRGVIGKDDEDITVRVRLKPDPTYIKKEADQSPPLRRDRRVVVVRRAFVPLRNLRVFGLFDIPHRPPRSRDRLVHVERVFDLAVHIEIVLDRLRRRR